MAKVFFVYQYMIYAVFCPSFSAIFLASSLFVLENGPSSFSYVFFVRVQVRVDSWRMDRWEWMGVKLWTCVKYSLTPTPKPTPILLPCAVLCYYIMIKRTEHKMYICFYSYHNVYFGVRRRNSSYLRSVSEERENFVSVAYVILIKRYFFIYINTNSQCTSIKRYF